MTNAVTKDDIRELLSYFDERFQRIDEKFQRIDEKFQRIDEKFDSIDKQFKIFENRLINQGEVISKINTKLDSLENSMKQFAIKLDVLYAERQENSIYVEKDLNNHVNIFLQHKYPDSEIINLKEKMTEPSQVLYHRLNEIHSTVTKTKKGDKVIPFLNITDKQSLLLYPPNMMTEETNNPISELDGLYLVNYKDHRMIDGKFKIVNVSELFIVEAKLSFNLTHLQQKIDKFSLIKQLITTPRNKFTIKEYYAFVSKYLHYVDRISIFYGTPCWLFDLKDYSVINNKLSLSSTRKSNSVEYSQILDRYSNYLINDIDQLYDDDVVYPLLERPDLHFLRKTETGYIGYSDVDSIHGGSNSDESTSE